MPETIPFAAWEPDKSDRENPTGEAKGVYSYAQQYAPFPDLVDYGAASDVDSYTKVLLHMDGADATTAFPDDSPSPKTFTAAGNAQIDTAQSKFGGASGLFDGTGDWISAADHADFNLGAGDWTADFWFKCNAAGGTTEHMAGQSDSSQTATTVSFHIHRTTGNFIRGRVAVGSTVTTVTGTTQFTDAVNTDWHHVALVRTGDVLKLFIDGTQEGGDQALTGTVNDSSNALRIGACGEDTADPWTGWIDEFRLSVGIARWTAAFTPPTAPYSFGAGAEDVVLGAKTVYDDDTTPAIFYGDDDRLYRLVDRIAVDVSKAAGYGLSASNTWQGAQFGNNVVFVSGTENPQHYTLGSSVDFADLAGTPPANATSVARINDFLMMGKAFTVHWCAFNDVTDWVPAAATQAGNQELDQEQGEIMSIVGLDYAAIFQERAVRRAIYVGPPVIFDFGQDYVEKAGGCISRNGAAPFNKLIFYVADSGFRIFDGQSSASIGHGKVDDYFVHRLNYAYRHKVAVGIDPQRKLVVFGYPAGSNQFISELLIYAVEDRRWTRDEIDLEFLYDTPAEAETIDTSGGFWDASIDDAPLSTFNIDSAGTDDRRRRLAGFTTSDHRLATFSGSARAATLHTREFEPEPGRRAFVTEIWPVGDIQQGNVSAAVGYRRALPGAAMQFTNPTSMNRAGFCPQRIDARFMLGRVLLGAGANWRRMEGIHATAIPTGQR